MGGPLHLRHRRNRAKGHEHLRQQEFARSIAF
jgi:hypothetical protein